jgi:hypothetical protein
MSSNGPCPEKYLHSSMPATAAPPPRKTNASMIGKVAFAKADGSIATVSRKNKVALGIIVGIDGENATVAIGDGRYMAFPAKKPLVQPSTMCPDCRKSLPSSAKFCRRCGFKIGGDPGLFGNTGYLPVPTPEAIANRAPTPIIDGNRAHVPTHAELRARAMLTCQTPEPAKTFGYLVGKDAPRIVPADAPRPPKYFVPICAGLILISIILTIIASTQVGVDVMEFIEHLWN